MTHHRTSSARARHLLLVLLAMVGASPAATGASANVSTCSTLKGTVLTDNAHIRIVSRPGSIPSTLGGGRRQTGKRYVGCAKPSGRPRTLGYNVWNDVESSGRTYARGKVAGTFVIVRETLEEGGAGTNVFTQTLVDLATGRRRVFWRFESPEGGCPEEHPERYYGPPKQLVLGTNGILAGVFVPQGSLPTVDDAAACYEPAGRALVIVSVPGRPLERVDEGPVEEIRATSLALKGRTVTWTHAGTKRSFTA